MDYSAGGEMQSGTRNNAIPLFSVHVLRMRKFRTRHAQSMLCTSL